MAARGRELDKLIAPLKDKLKAFIKVRLDAVANGDKIAAASAALMEALNSERQKLTETGATKEYFEYVEAFAKKYGDAGELEKKFNIPKPTRDPLQKAVHWIASYIDREDVNNLRKYRDESLKQFEAKKAEFEKLDPEFSKYVGSHLLAMIDDLLANAVLHTDAGKVVDPALLNLKTVEDSLNRSQADKANKAWEDLKPKADVITQSTHWFIFPEVKDFCIRYAEMAARFGGAVDDVVATKEIDEIGKSTKTLINTLEKALTTKNIANATKYFNDLKEKISPLIEKHANHAKALPIITEANRVIEKYQTEIEPMMLESEAKVLVDKMRVPLKQLETSLSKKDDVDALKHRETVEQGLNDLKAKYSKVDIAKQCIDQADALLKRMENELGAIIAEKSIKELSEKLKTQLTLTEKYLNDKNVLQVQTYAPKVEDLVVQMKRYETHVDAKKWIDQSQKLLQRVNTELGSAIAADEIDKLSNILEGPLNALEAAIQRKDLNAAVKFQERVTSLATPLRKYANDSQAVSILKRVSTLLKSIERDVAPLIAAEKAGKLSSQIQPLISSINQASDANAANVIIAKLLNLVHPVRVQYGHFDAIKSVLAPIDELINKLKPQLNQFQQQEAQRAKAQIEKELQQIDASKSNPGVVVILLRDLNKMIQPLKKTLLIDTALNALITRVDQMNMEIYGRVPLEEEFMPVIEINSKTPAAWQKVLKKINNHNANINAQILSIKQAFDATDRKGAANAQMMRGELPNPWDKMQKSVSDVHVLLDKLESNSLLGELVKADANCPHIHELKQSVAATRQFIQEMDAQNSVMGRYIQTNSTAFFYLRSAVKLLDCIQALTPGDRDTQWTVGRGVLAYDVARAASKDTDIAPYNGCLVVNRILTIADDLAKQAQKVLPDDCFETVECINTAAQLKRVVAEGMTVQSAQFVDYYIKHFESDTESFNRCTAWINSLKELCPGAKEIVVLDNKLAAKLDEIRKFEENRRTEAEAKKKEEEERCNAVSLELQAEANTFTGGSVTASGMVWTYKPGYLSCESGQLKGWAGQYSALPSEGSISLRLNENMAHFPSLIWRWNGNLLWAQFRSIQVDTSVQSWTVFESKDLVVNADVSGLVPRQIAVMVSNMTHCIPEMQRRIKDDVQKQRLCEWKKTHFEKLRVEFNKTCKGCSTSGGNWKFCYDCEKMYCTSIKCHNNQSINVCIFCKGYNGGSIPTSANYLKTPQDQSIWINTHIALPQWVDVLINFK